MNFSFHLTVRKVLSMTLSLVMVTALFTGCKQDVPTPETEANLNLNLSEDTTPSEPEMTTEATTAPVINENTGTVTSVLNIRSSPSTEATVIGTLYAGDKVEVSRREVVTGIDWAYIIAPESGWIVMEFVEMDLPTQQPVQPNTDTPAGEDETGDEPDTNTDTNTTNIKAVVNANGLNIRSEASTSGKVQGAYNKGDVVTILETKNGWGRTNKGWIKMEYVNTNSTSIGGSTTSKDDDKDTTTTEQPDIISNGSTTVILKGVVKVTDLNVRTEGSTNGERLGNLTYGARVEILEKSGNWGRTKDGWICLDYVYEDGTTGSKTAEGVVTGDELNIRSGPGTGYATVGSYMEGDEVTILEQFTYNGTTWGCTNQGWISMDYVDVGEYIDGSNEDGTQTGTVIGNNLNIRSGAGSDYPAVGTLNYGDRVTITEEKHVGDTTWGKTEKGWISLDYVALD